MEKPEKPPRPSAGVNLNKRIATFSAEKETQQQVQVQHVQLEKSSSFRSDIQPVMEEEKSVPLGFDKVLLADCDETASVPSETVKSRCIDEVVEKSSSVPENAVPGTVGWLIPESIQEINDNTCDKPGPGVKPPIAAPRTSLINKDEVKISVGEKESGKMVVSVHTENKPVSHSIVESHELSKDNSSPKQQSAAEGEKCKPVVPERPLALRQGSFRIPQQSAEDGDKAGNEVRARVVYCFSNCFPLCYFLCTYLSFLISYGIVKINRLN